MIMLLIGGAGGGINYLRENIETIRIRFLILEIVMGAFVSWTVGVFLWSKGIHPYVVFPIIGVCAMYSKEILRILKRKALAYLQR